MWEGKVLTAEGGRKILAILVFFSPKTLTNHLIFSAAEGGRKKFSKLPLIHGGVLKSAAKARPENFRNPAPPATQEQQLVVMLLFLILPLPTARRPPPARPPASRFHASPLPLLRPPTAPVLLLLLPPPRP